MQITTNMIPTSAASAAAPMQAAIGGNGAQGGFMSIVAQLMTACGDLNLDMSAIDALKSRLEQEGQELSAQMLAQLMSNPLVSGFVLQQQGSDQAAAIGGNTPQLDWSKLQSLLSPTATEPNAESVKGEVISHVVGQSELEAELPQNLLAQSKFQSMLMDAKGSAKAATEQGSAKTLDIDSLQEEIKSGKFNLVQHSAGIGMQASSVEAASQNPVGEAPLLEQVTDGITAKLAEGKSEFVVKLRPEGLGEITVKLAEVGSKIALTITTSSEHTGRMLSAELGALKEALRPYNADVHEVVAGTTQASSYLFSEGDKGNFARQQAFNQQQSRNNRSRSASGLAQEAISVPTLEQGSALDLHI